ncbi:MAG: hypothetical protein ABR595_05875 [Psychroflexus sp.]
MGVLKKLRNKDSLLKANNSQSRTKGQRLGWQSLSETKTVNLNNILIDGEVVVVDNEKPPILVP